MDVAARRDSKRPAPYVARRPRRSSRLGGATDLVDLDDDEASAAAREAPAAEAGGLFSRLFRFFPLGKKQATTVVDEPTDDAMSEEEQADKSELETSQESLESVLDAAVGKPLLAQEVVEVVAKPTQNGHASDTSPANDKPSTERKPSAPSLTSNVFGTGTDKAKALKIGNTDGEKDQFVFPRVTARRRNKPLSPTVAESPLAVIKKKKPISFEEYERLSSQLRNLVEPTPQNAHVLTRSALAMALDGRGQSDALVAQENGRDRRELSVAALPSAKRARPSEDHLPITLPREDRLARKPKPSRLLTGTRRDAASRSAYSAAVAEKILSTLNKIQAPLDKESQKPTPSTSLSWAKHHLALTNQDSSKQIADVSMDADEEMPPTASIPKVMWKPVVADVLSKVASETSKPSGFSFPQPSCGAETSKSIGALFGVLSSPSRKEPAATHQIERSHQVASTVSVACHKQKMGEYSFTLPASSALPSKSVEDENIQFFFTPPPALREPPRRSPGQKATAASSTAPFSFMPASPKIRPESLTKSVPAKTKPAAKFPEMPPLKSTTSSSTNPLARFTQSNVGSWRCPTCAVMNGPEHSKCPCCETAQPVTASVASETAAVEKPSASTSNPLARFMQTEPGSWKCPGCAVTNGAKYLKCPCCETDKPGGSLAPAADALSSSSTTSGGFSFGISKSSDAKRSEAASSAGFSFGVSTTTEAKNAESAGSAGFTFGAGAGSSSTGSSSGFTFNGPSAAAAPPVGGAVVGFTFGSVSPSLTSPDEETTKKTSSFSFGDSSVESIQSNTTSNKRKTTDHGADETSEKKQATAVVKSPPSKPSGGFSFGVSAATSSGTGSSSFKDSFGSTAAAGEEAKRAGFSFGTTSSGSAKKPAFGLDAPISTPQKTSIPSFLAAASASKVAAADEKKDTPSAFGTTSTPSFAASTPAPNASSGSSPSFTFGSAASKPKETEGKPAFSFGGSSSVSSDFGAKSAASAKPFSFSSATDQSSAPVSAVTTTSEPSSFSQAKPDSATKKPSFEFGSSHVVSKPSVSFGADSTSSSTSPSTSSATFTFGSSSADNSAKKADASGFTFGAGSADTSAKKADAPAFTFGAAPLVGNSFGSSTPSFGDKLTSGSFGQSAATFGSNAPTSSGFGTGPSTAPTSFGSTASTSSGFGLAQSTSTGFGAATLPASSGFGVKASSGFGSATSSGFGATTATSFGAASTGTAFGTTPVTTPSFGNNPAKTPTAPAFSFGASTPAASQPAFGFGAPSTSSAFSTPSTDVFGSSKPTPGFGSAPSAGGFGSSTPAPAFGANPAMSYGAAPTPSPAFGAPSASSAFGGNGFGQSAPAAGGFGVPTPTPSPAFGNSFATPSSSFGASAGSFGATPSSASSAFGGTSSPAFGAPATPSFGAPPTPAFGGGAPNSAFGAQPAPGDGFSMGAAPPKRRILKAKTRAKR